MIDPRQNPASFEVYVDRVESGLAVIVASDGSGFRFDFPLNRLPAGTKAGDHLIIRVHPDPERTELALQRIAKLQQELKQTLGSDATEFKL